MRPKVGETITIVEGETYNSGLLLRSKTTRPNVVEFFEGEWYVMGSDTPIDVIGKQYTVLYSPPRTFAIGDTLTATRTNLEELPHRVTLVHEDGTAYRVWYVDDDAYPTFYPTGGEQRKPEPARSLDLAAKGGIFTVTWVPEEDA